jgi:hypothetical protein
MNILLILVAFITPMMVAEFYSSREYDLSFKEHFERWRFGKYLALFLSLLYLFALVIWEYTYTETIFTSLYTGIYLSLIIYSKPFGELILDYAADFNKVGLLDDAAFIIGWIGLIYECITYLFYF